MAAVLAAVEVAAGVAATATAPDDGPISTSNPNEATSSAAPVTTARPPSLCTACQSMRRDRDKVVSRSLDTRAIG